MSVMESQELPNKPFFQRRDWSAFWTATILSFAVYFYTLCPTVGLEDSGELAVAADWLGVPHPPGYPIWTMLGWVFARVFSFVQYRGQPNPAWGIGLLSAVCGALATGLTALLICCSGRHIIAESPLLSHDMDRRTERAICWISAIAGSLLLAFAPIMWSQAVIIEVYSLNALFLMLLLTLIYMWTQRPSAKILLWASFIFGLGLTNYQVILLAGFALAICIMLRKFDLFRDFLIAAVPYAAVFVLIKLDLLPIIKHPTHITAHMYLALNVVWLGVLFVLLPNGRTVSLSILLAQLGVAFYAYMPIVSDLRNPPMNWGYPRTWEGFLHAISRGQYEKIAPVNILTPRFLQQIGTYVADLRINFQLPMVLIGFLPFAAWRLSWGKRDIDLLPVGLLLTAIAVALLPLGARAPLYKLPAAGVALIMLGGALLFTIDRFDTMIREHLTAPRALLWEKLTAIAVLTLIALTGLALVARDILEDTEPLRKTVGPLPREQVHAIMGELAFTIGVTVMLGAAVALIAWLHRKRIMTLTVNEHCRQWLMSTTVTFAILSIGLIALADLKMDIQDTFIQRVKFISSQALFALWIGYGLIFALSALNGWLGRQHAGNRVALLLVAALPLVPLAVNQWDEELLRVYGGAEQNRHDFGWQFGNYQLRGAAAILEELSPEEEPLPNPVYPPAMGHEAIFFGGTDPGRFVPTYMIYSADVRPDVSLITQNALADNTYLQVMRDLYGNDIWLPSAAESSEAFRVFVSEVESGKREAHAGITVSDGRVQVSGVLGVMEINGILARMIFDRNNYRHDFYVEESYVIRWMYPHLSPHGLIMKINREPLPRLPPDTVQDDLDFWDWYTRRLISTREFRRDVVARKSFSKLRSALAGLYAYRGMLIEAEHAFMEAYLLYPLSPEANFRLAEVYMRRREFDKAEAIITAFGDQDPANERVAPFLHQIVTLRQAWARIETVQREAPEGRLDANRALEMLNLYRQVGDMGNFQQLAQGMLANTELPPELHIQLARQFQAANQPRMAVQALDLAIARLPEGVRAAAFIEIAQLYGRAQRPDRMRDAMSRYLEREPTDWKAWLDHATLSLQMRDPDTAGSSLQQAVRHGRQEAERTIAANPTLSELYRHVQTQRRQILNLRDRPNPLTR